jgi:catechol 2,3-dioxygenase-like lactoylglutathione lyase family enzyme
VSDLIKTAADEVRTVVTMTPRIDAIGIVVADMAAALDFYRRLGIEFAAGAEAEPHVEVALPGGLRLMFDTQSTIQSFDASWTKPVGGPAMALAFDCGDAAGVDNTHDDLVAAGHESHRAPWDAFWGQRYATVRDPDGNPVDLFAALPAAAPAG